MVIITDWHVNSVGKTRIIYRIFFGKPVGKNPYDCEIGGSHSGDMISCSPVEVYQCFRCTTSICSPGLCLVCPLNHTTALLPDPYFLIPL
jgi:hypothetical protein